MRCGYMQRFGEDQTEMRRTGFVLMIFPVFVWGASCANGLYISTGQRPEIRTDFQDTGSLLTALASFSAGGGVSLAPRWTTARCRSDRRSNYQWVGR